MAASSDISGLSRFHEVVSCSPQTRSPSSPRASCPIPDTTCPLEGGDLEGWLKELPESDYFSAAPRFSSLNITLLFPCSKSPEGLMWPQAHRDWIWWSNTAVDSHCARLGKECWLKMWGKLASQRAWTTKPCPADSRGTLRACCGSCEHLAVRWDVAATCLHIASCDTQMSPWHKTLRTDLEESHPLTDILGADIHSTHTFTQKAPMKLPQAQPISPLNHLFVCPP